MWNIVRAYRKLIKGKMPMTNNYMHEGQLQKVLIKYDYILQLCMLNHIKMKTSERNSPVLDL